MIRFVVVSLFVALGMFATSAVGASAKISSKYTRTEVNGNCCEKIEMYDDVSKKHRVLTSVCDTGEWRDTGWYLVGGLYVDGWDEVLVNGNNDMLIPVAVSAGGVFSSGGAPDILTLTHNTTAVALLPAVLAW